jgi:acetolactate synthase regulatory subunit
MGKKQQRSSVVSLPLARAASASTAEIAKLVGWNPATGCEIEYPDGRRVSADMTLDADPASMAGWVAEGRRVLAVETRSGSHVVTGLMRMQRAAASANRAEVNIRVDGDRLLLLARNEIELRCGEASIVLRSDGVVTIRGKHVASRSRGANIMSGATIRLN